MSIQFGRWDRRGHSVDEKYFADVSALLAKYPSDGDREYKRDNIRMLLKPLDATKEVSQAAESLDGQRAFVLTFDGRLDNRGDLFAELGHPTASLSDSALVLASYERWDTKCFQKLSGDWALALWLPAEKTLLLAKDFAGTRQLYYSIEPNSITWSTVLDPLVQLSPFRLALSEEYVAGYLASFPETHLTPYSSIQAVPAGAFVRITPEAETRYDYESLAPAHSARCLTDAEYEDTFRYFFRRAILRRLRSVHPVIAELSGGMDSTAIVCVADQLLSEGKGETPRLDTLSYFDDGEPNWDEQPYFSLVEKKRGRTGIHIDCGTESGVFEPASEEIFAPFPGQNRAYWDRQRELRPLLLSGSYRTLLSGIGGDEFLGGVPDPVPELQDLLLQFRWKKFARKLIEWSVYRRSPWMSLAAEVVRDYLPRAVRRTFENPRAPHWLTKNFANRHADTFWSDSSKQHVWGQLPSFATSLHSLDQLRRQLNCLHLNPICPLARSFPYLDRDLLDFLIGVPRDQLVRPGQRRSLLRRALAGIVPAEILSRRRKAYVSRRPLLALEAAFPQIEKLFEDSVLAANGWLDSKVFLATLSAARQGQIEQIVPVLNVLQMELWLESSGYVDTAKSCERGHDLRGRKTRYLVTPSGD